MDQVLLGNIICKESWFELNSHFLINPIKSDFATLFRWLKPSSQSDLQEDFNWNLLSLQLLAKFLGLVWYMPYYTTQRIPTAVLNTLKESRTEVRIPSLHTTVCDYLSLLSYSFQDFKSIFDLYTNFQPFPLDMETMLAYSISEGTLTLTLPW